MTEKLYKIGEAADLLHLKTYVLRFWEMEFPQIAPTRTPAGQRLYSERDVAVLKRIRHLLHERGLTIDGARRQLAEDERRSPHTSPPLAAEMQSLIDICDPDSAAPEGHEPQGLRIVVLDAMGEAPSAAGPDPMRTAETLRELRELRDLLAGGLSGALFGVKKLPEEQES